MKKQTSRKQITQKKSKTLQNPSEIKQIDKFLNKIICGDALEVLKTIPSESIDAVVTSPPYWALRDYEVRGQIGLENNLDDYLMKLILVFDEVKRVLKPTGTCFVNFGDTYASSSKGGQQNNVQGNIFDALTKTSVIPKLKTNLKIPDKSLCLIPERFALLMIERGWILRNEIIWHKSNAMPSSVKDRFTVDFEKIFFFVKSKRYYFKQQFEPVRNPAELKRRYSNPFDQHLYWNKTRKATKSLEAIKKSQQKLLKQGRNKRCVWTVATAASRKYQKNHFAVFPEKLIETPIKAGCRTGGVVLDPFMGSGTTAIVAKKLKRNFIGIELNRKYVKLARNRLETIK